MVEDRETTGSRERILEAASEVFAEHGFRNARTRDIAQRASVNIAAIHYYFGDKQRLYDAVIQNAYASLPEVDISQSTDQQSAAERLQGFIGAFLGQLLGGGRANLYTRLIAREVSDPTPVLDQLIDKAMRPQVEYLLEIVRELLGDVGDEQVVRRCTGSVLGQCLYFHLGRPVILSVGLESELTAAMIEELAEHVTKFSLAAIRTISEES